MQGGQSKALIIASQTMGWDPTRIAPNGESIANFDCPPQLYANQAGTGRMPGGSPDSWPDGYSMSGLKLSPDDPVSFRTPNRATGSDAKRATINGAPAPASPGIRETSNERSPR